MSEHEVALDLPSGSVALPVTATIPSDARIGIVLAPGAGSGRDHPWLTAVSEQLAEHGIATARFDFAYRVLGRRAPGPAAHATRAWLAVHNEVGGLFDTVTWCAGGKSYGGRMASMAAAEGLIAPAGLVYFGYPLHPPGRPDALRAAHLSEVTQPQLFVSGRTDPFVQPTDDLERAVASCPDATLRWVAGAHSFEQTVAAAGRRLTVAETVADAVTQTASWMQERRADLLSA